MFQSILAIICIVKWGIEVTEGKFCLRFQISFISYSWSRPWFSFIDLILFKKLLYGSVTWPVEYAKKVFVLISGRDVHVVISPCKVLSLPDFLGHLSSQALDDLMLSVWNPAWPTRFFNTVPI